MAVIFNVPGIQALTNALNNFKGSAANASNQPFASQIGGKQHQQYIQSQIQSVQQRIAIGGTNPTLNAQLSQLQKRLHAMQAINPQAQTGFSSMGAGFRVVGAMVRALASQSPYAAGLLTSVIGTAGPLGIALGALTIGVLAVVGAFKFLESYVGGFGTRQVSTYANTNQQATLDAIASAIGVDKDSFSGIASRMPGGATQMMALINSYMAMGNNPGSQRFLKANNLPPEMARLFDLTDEQRKRAMSGENHMVSKDDVKTITQVTAAWNELIAVMQNKLYKTLMYIIDVYKLIPAAFKTSGLEIIYNFFNWLFKTISNIIPKNSGFIPNGREGKHRTTPYDNPQTPHENAWNKALKDVTDGINRSTKRMDNAANTFSNAVDAFSYTTKNGIFGGLDSDRAKRAFPSNWAWSWSQLDQQNQNDMMLTGAFTL